MLVRCLLKKIAQEATNSKIILKDMLISDPC